LGLQVAVHHAQAVQEHQASRHLEGCHTYTAR
jgi:hypothetical protein